MNMDITFFTLSILLANMPKICANVCEQSLTLTFESVIKASVLIVSTAFSSLPFRAVTAHSEFVYSREEKTQIAFRCLFSRGTRNSREVLWQICGIRRNTGATTTVRSDSRPDQEAAH